MTYRKIPPSLRREVYTRDGMKCQLCGCDVVLTKNIRTESDYKREASLDHIHAFSKGGETKANNLRTVCRSCNSQKKDGTEADVKFLNLVNGDFTRIHNSILLALARSKLNSEESRILFAIIAKTYGYSKAEDWIANSQLEKITGIHRSHCSRSVSRLVQRGIVTKFGNMIKFNKYFFQWRELPKLATKEGVPNQASSITRFGKPVLPKLVHTKETSTKDNITKSFAEKNCGECNNTRKVKVGQVEITCPRCRTT